MVSTLSAQAQLIALQYTVSSVNCSQMVLPSSLPLTVKSSLPSANELNLKGREDPALFLLSVAEITFPQQRASDT